MLAGIVISVLGGFVLLCLLCIQIADVYVAYKCEKGVRETRERKELEDKIHKELEKGRK